MQCVEEDSNSQTNTAGNSTQRAGGGLVYNPGSQCVEEARVVKRKTRLLLWLLVAFCFSSAPHVLAQAPNRWAVIIGISRFPKLPADQQLKYADQDAQAFAKFITSPRGGAVPAENVTLMLNENATKASILKRLGATLPRNAKPNDLVYIFLATHGMIEKDVARANYILGSDADPEDLYRTAVPMRDLDDIISNRLQNAGRIVLLADLSRSGTLGSVHASLQQVAGKRRELVGLLASRRGEGSPEGPQFCGGHGAFACTLLKGLSGAADADKDSAVTVSELISFVSDQLRQATNDKQHLLTFGAFENEVPLSFVDKAGPADWRAFSPGPK